MIKTFEQFTSPSEFDKRFDKESKWSNEDLVDMLSVIALIWNHAGNDSKLYGEFEKMCYFFNKAPWNFINADGLFDWSDDYDWNSLTDDDRQIIADRYTRVWRLLQLSDYPNMDDIDEILLPIKDLTEIEMTIELDKREFSFRINTIPSVKYFSDKKLKADYREWFSITSEIEPAINRILDLGYDCDFYILQKGDIELKIRV